jgi:hypothetical protein
LLAADLNIAGFGVEACWVWRSRLRHCRRRRWCRVRPHSRWWRRHRGDAGNVTSDGHSQPPASGGDTVPKRADASLTLVLAGNLANCPKSAFRKFKERCPGAEVWVIREATNVRPVATPIFSLPTQTKTVTNLHTCDEARRIAANIDGHGTMRLNGAFG